LFHYTEPGERDVANTDPKMMASIQRDVANKFTDPKIVASILSPIDPNEPYICKNPELLAILIQHIKGATSMYSMIPDETFLNNEAGYALFQIYFTLDQLRMKFTHYDLHTDNVLLYEPVVGGYIHYHFYQVDRVISFKSKYMVKIIDYGRSFCPESNDYLKKLREHPECNYIGTNRGFWTSQNVGYINILSKNESHDLRLLSECKLILNHYDIRPKNNDLMKLFDTPYDSPFANRHGIPENRERIEGVINNVGDAHRYLTRLISTPIYKQTNEKTYQSSRKIGDLHVYGDKPMEYKAVP